MKIKNVLIILATAIILGNFGGFLCCLSNFNQVVNAESITVWDGQADTDWYDDEEIVFHINRPEQLAGLSNLANSGNTMKGKTIVLDNDLYINDTKSYDTWSELPPENVWNSIPEFCGTLDGNNHSIFGLYSETGGFIRSTKDASIKNLTLRDSYISCEKIFRAKFNSQIFGVLVNETTNSSISNCITDGTIKIKLTIDDLIYEEYDFSIGGIVGKSNSTTIYDCKNYVNINEYSTCRKQNFFPDISNNYKLGNGLILGNIRSIHVGGICGTTDSLIVNCLNKGTIESNSKFFYCTGTTYYEGTNQKTGNIFFWGYVFIDIGGICGLSTAEIYNTCNQGEIRINCKENESVDAAFNMGGIIGNAKELVCNSYNLADISCDGLATSLREMKIKTQKNYSNRPSIGGIVGSSKSEIKNVYNAGKIVYDYCSDNNSVVYIGSIVSKGNTLLCENTYYLSGTALESGLGEDAVSKSASNMKTEAFAERMGNYFHFVKDNYPKLGFELENTEFLFIDTSNIIFSEYGDTEKITIYTNSDKNISFSSDNPLIATVDEFGVITAVGKGVTNIDIFTGETMQSCIVTVGYEYYIDKIELTIKENRSQRLRVYSSRDQNIVSNSKIDWKSSNPAIAMVDENGLITSIKSGKCVITASIGDTILSCNLSIINMDGVVEETDIDGDINYDGKVDSLDVIKYQKYLFGNEDIPEYEFDAYDINKDKMIDLIDYIILKSIILQYD